MEEYIKMLLTDRNKSAKIKIKGRIQKIIDEGEYLSVKVECDDGIYKGLTIIKSDIFPIPNANDSILIDEIQYKYDEYFKLRLFIKAKLIEEKNMSINASNTIQRDYNFTTDNIISNLKDLLNIDKELFSNLFEVDSINEKTFRLSA